MWNLIFILRHVGKYWFEYILHRGNKENASEKTAKIAAAKQWIKEIIKQKPYSGNDKQCHAYEVADKQCHVYKVADKQQPGCEVEKLQKELASLKKQMESMQQGKG